MKNILKVVALVFLFSGINNGVIYCTENTPVSKIERSSEILETEKKLQERIDKGVKVFIKKIIVSGITLIKGDQIKEIILPFKNHWFSKDEIQVVLDSINAGYEQNGYYGKVSKISYQIKKNNLKIIVEEIK